MTAIFLVWNKNGFAVASDQNVSLYGVDEDGNRKTLWLESGKKLHVLQDKKIVIANSGNLTINGITLNSIIKKWSETISKELPNLTDYVCDFIDWLTNAELHFHNEGSYSLDQRIDSIIDEIIFHAGV